MPSSACTARAVLVAVLLALTCAPLARAHPQFWVNEYAPSCTAVPTAKKSCHKAPIMDRSTVVSATGGKSATTLCAGKPFSISVKFPEAREAAIMTSGGSLVRANSAKCKNAYIVSKATGLGATTSVAVPATAPPAGSVSVSVVSATGACAPFQITTASFNVVKC